jgi:hypothetical protein
MLLILTGILLCTQLFRQFDAEIRRAGWLKPYYAVHVIHNLSIVALTAQDVWRSFTLQGGQINWSAIILCYALHFYHIVDYYPVFRFDDWLHHGLMIGIALPLGSMIPSGPLLGCNLFFTTGLPGAISYGLLFLERNERLNTWTTKWCNAATNLWLRAPGCVAQSALTLSYVLSEPHISSWQTGCGALIALLTAWNGLYFMEQAIRSKWIANANSD